MYAAVSAIFRNAIKMETNKNETFYVFLDRKISHFFIPGLFLPALFLMIPGLISCSILTFWEVYLIEVSFTCDPNLDCFPYDADNNTNLQDDPVLSCTNLGMSDNITIICYHFAINFTDAAGVIGGLLSIIGFVFMVLKSVLIWFLDLGGNKEKQDKCHRR